MVKVSLFDLEVKEKKEQAYLNRAKSGAKGSSRSRKGMSTPYDFMSKTEKKKLNGEVERYNMYETILPIKEFQFKDEETKKALLTKWREVHDNLHIRTQMGISNKTFYDLVADLGIPKKRRIEEKGKRNTPKQAKAIIAPKKTLLEFAEETVQEELELKKEIIKEVAKVEEINTPVLVTTGMQLTYNRVYSEEELNTIFTKCQIMVEGENKKFQLTLSLTEIIEG